MATKKDRDHFEAIGAAEAAAEEERFDRAAHTDPGERMLIGIELGNLTVRKYHEMAEAGILTERDRVELIDGELIDMTPIGSKHAYCVDRLNQLFVRQAGEGCLVRIQNPIQLGEYGEPEPDLAVVRNRDYSSAHPGPSDVLLIVEVADRSLSYDREIKVPLYARYGIPEVWLIDLPAERVEIRREPKEGRYLQSDEIRSGPLSPSRIPEIVLNVSDLWTVSKV